jgi:hypothetical protein
MTLRVPHYMHVYPKPRTVAFGGALGADTAPALTRPQIRRYQAFQYKHVIAANGGCDTASCAVKASLNEALYILENLVGNEVRFYVDNPSAPIWDGVISRVTIETGALSISRSTDNMSNRVNVVFFDQGSAAAIKTTVNASVDVAGSQALYGIREGTFDAGVHYNPADLTHKTILRDTIRSIWSYPQNSISPSTSAFTVTIECEGFYHWVFANNNYQSTAIGTVPATTIIHRLCTRNNLDAPPNAPYVYRTGVTGGLHESLTQTNLSFNIRRQNQGGSTYLQFILSAVEAGDGTQQWTWGITGWHPQLTRLIYYRVASTAVRYQTSLYRGSGRLRDIYGRFVKPWDVRPDAGVRIQDYPIGASLIGDDPRISYIRRIEYDAEAGTVQWQSGDNITMEGVFQNDRYFRRQGRDFGAIVRQVV